MKSAPSVAASLCPEVRQDIAIQALSKSEPISHLAADFQVSRKFVYQQAHKARQALDESFGAPAGESEILFHLPVTKTWLFHNWLRVLDVSEQNCQLANYRLETAIRLNELIR